jgi:hypothetical protein
VPLLYICIISTSRCRTSRYHSSAPPTCHKRNKPRIDIPLPPSVSASVPACPRTRSIVGDWRECPLTSVPSMIPLTLPSGMSTTHEHHTPSKARLGIHTSSTRHIHIPRWSELTLNLVRVLMLMRVLHPYWRRWVCVESGLGRCERGVKIVSW